MNDKNLFKEIKNHIENWKIGCKYKIPFDYVGLRLVLRRNSNNIKRPEIKDFFHEKTDLEKIIVKTLIEYQFGENLKNGDYITGVKKMYFNEVAKMVVKKYNDIYKP